MGGDCPTLILSRSGPKMHSSVGRGKLRRHPKGNDCEGAGHVSSREFWTHSHIHSLLPSCSTSLIPPSVAPMSPSSQLWHLREVFSGLALVACKAFGLDLMHSGVSP